MTTLLGLFSPGPDSNDYERSNQQKGGKQVVEESLIIASLELEEVPGSDHRAKLWPSVEGASMRVSAVRVAEALALSWRRVGAVW